MLHDFAAVAATAQPPVTMATTSRQLVTMETSPSVNGLTVLGIAASTREKLKAAVQHRPSTLLKQNSPAAKMPRLNTQHITATRPVSLPTIIGTVVQTVAPVAVIATPIVMPSATLSTPIVMTTPSTTELDLSRVQFEAADTSTTSTQHTWSSRSSSDDDNSDRRRRFLESNRAAATRCRQKKKAWAASLESRANCLEKINSNLEREMRSLKREIHDLKLLLLEHKHCPAMSHILLTQQQQQQQLQQQQLQLQQQQQQQQQPAASYNNVS